MLGSEARVLPPLLSNSDLISKTDQAVYYLTQPMFDYTWAVSAFVLSELSNSKEDA